MRFSGRVPAVLTENDRNESRKGGEVVTRVRRLKHLLYGSGSSEGQTIVEFALVFMLFIFLIFGVVDFGHLFFAEMAVQNAVQEAARFGSTGNHLPDPKNPGQDLSRVSSITTTLQQSLAGAYIKNVQISSLYGGKGSAGGPGDTMTLTVQASVPLLTPLIAGLFPNGRYDFTSSVTIKNEPFPTSETK